MWNFALPALQAIGINAGVNLLRRKPIFENAATAGVTGGVLGGFNGGGLFSSNPTAAAASSAPTSATAFEASMGLPSSAFTESNGVLAALGNRASSIPGMTAGADGVLRNSEYFTDVLGMPTYTGGEGLLSNAMGNIGGKFSEFSEDLTPQNLLGVSMLLNNMNQAQPMPSAGGGGEIRGTPPKQERFVTGQVYGRKKRGEA